MPWNDFSQSVKLLSLVGTLKKEAFDVFPPQAAGLVTRVEAIALNPQPLPPSDPLLTGAVAMSRRLAELAVEADVRGDDVGWLTEIIDDWCGTPWPRKWPWPGPGPTPGEGPRPEPWVVAQARAAGAVVFASVAAGLGDGALRSALADGAGRLGDIATQEM